MVKVELDVTEQNLVDFHHRMPVIKGERAFQFEVGKWDSDAIAELTFSDFRANSNHLNPMELVPVEFHRKVRGRNGPGSWTIRKSDPNWRTGRIQLEANPDDDDRRLIEYTLTMKLQDGTCVAIDPPLDERRRKR